MKLVRSLAGLTACCVAMATAKTTILGAVCLAAVGVFILAGG